MFFNNFSVVVEGGNESESGYVEMQHGQTYRLRLGNNQNRQADARVEIDGKLVGTWRIPQYQNIVLERPVNNNGLFTFYRLGTVEAQIAQLQAQHPDLGLIKVTFTPEKEFRREPQAVYRGACGRSFSTTRSAGGTGLSGRSYQEFGTAHNIEYDYSQQVTINLRLVEAVQQPYAVRPLTQSATPIPPRVF